MQEIQRLEIEHIGTLIAAGLKSIDLAGARSGGRLFRYSGDLKKVLLDMMWQARQFGADHVAKEMQRQEAAKT